MQSLSYTATYLAVLRISKLRDGEADKDTGVNHANRPIKRFKGIMIIPNTSHWVTRIHHKWTKLDYLTTPFPPLLQEDVRLDSLEGCLQQSLLI